MMTKRAAKGDLEYVTECITSAVGNPLFYSVLVLLSIAVFLILDLDWIDSRLMNFVVVTFACVAVLPEVE